MKFKKVIFTSLLMLLSSSTTLAASGMINAGELFKNHPMFSDIEGELKEYLELSTKKLQKNSALLDSQQMELNANIKKMNPTTAKATQKDINEKRKLIDEQKKILQQKLSAFQERGRVRVLEDIILNSEKVRKALGLDLIIDSGSVVAIDEKLDVNKQVLESIKENYKPQQLIDELDLLRTDR